MGRWQQLRSFNHREVEALAARLAVRLQERLTPSELARMRFCALPRGGIFVLGYLSYFLDLAPEQLEPHPDHPLLLVDDCCISGARFWAYRRRHPGPIFFAHLVSHPEVRARIEREPEVLGCEAVMDLADLAPELFPDPTELAAWRQRSCERLGSGRYWVGIPERIAFPWTEPDTFHWNEATGQMEPGWRLAAPDRCLHNRLLLGLALRPGITPQYRSPDVVSYQFTGDQVNLCNLATQHCFSLHGTAAEMWRALVGYGSLEAVAEHIASQYQVQPAEALADTRRLVDQLLQLGLLEPVVANDSQLG